ncbi:MAG: thioredoxin [Acidobacteria bacterium]|nr:MAG: thioredoxin [Acidobacteriota bacterium]
MRRRLLPSSCFLAFVAAAACTASRAPAPPVENPRQVVAQVAGSNITLEDVDHRAGGKLQRLRDEEYQARHQALEEIIAERLVEKEAASRGLTTEALLKAEVEAKVPLPTPAEVKGIYEQNRASAGGRSLEQVAPLIERSLRQQRLAERAGQFRDELKARAAVKVSLEAPRTPLEIPADAPVLGPAGAPVTIVEYLDYQCPFCHRVQGVVDDVMSRYPGRVRFVHREFLLGKPRSLAAARAARCAGEQGKFWEYHRDLLVRPGDMGDEDLQRRAQAMGLEGGKFGACVASDRFDAAINRASESGTELGIAATPTFFINGRRLVGVHPVGEFRELIDSELRKSS